MPDVISKDTSVIPHEISTLLTSAELLTLIYLMEIRTRRSIPPQLISYLKSAQINWKEGQQTISSAYDFLTFEVPSLPTCIHVRYERVPFRTHTFLIPCNVTGARNLDTLSKCVHLNRVWVYCSESGHGEEPYPNPPHSVNCSGACIRQQKVPSFPGQWSHSGTFVRGRSFLSECLKVISWKQTQD
jgi:hypothetical protein